MQPCGARPAYAISDVPSQPSPHKALQFHIISRPRRLKRRSLCGRYHSRNSSSSSSIVSYLSTMLHASTQESTYINLEPKRHAPAVHYLAVAQQLAERSAIVQFQNTRQAPEARHENNARKTLRPTVHETALRRKLRERAEACGADGPCTHLPPSAKKSGPCLWRLFEQVPLNSWFGSYLNLCSGSPANSATLPTVPVKSTNISDESTTMICADSTGNGNGQGGQAS